MSTLIRDWVSQQSSQRKILIVSAELKLLISEDLNISTEGIFLQGSRGFATKDFFLSETPDLTESDWDFATEMTATYNDPRFLEKGWELCDISSYKDNDTMWVYEKEFEGRKIQLSLRKNLQRFIDCFNSVDNSFYFKYMHKSSNKCMDREDMASYWNSLYYTWDCGNGWTR